MKRYGQSPERLFALVEAAGGEVAIPLDFSNITRVHSTIRRVS